MKLSEKLAALEGLEEGEAVEEPAPKKAVAKKAAPSNKPLPRIAKDDGSASWDAMKRKDEAAAGPTAPGPASFVRPERGLRVSTDRANTAGFVSTMSANSMPATTIFAA